MNSSALLREEYVISSMADLRKTIPSGLGGNNILDAVKVIPHLDEQMVGFIQRSPFLQLGTSDATGMSFVSPKGDEAGFVEVVQTNGSTSALLIPDRPGNRLIFGLQNIIANPKASVLFEIPGNTTTLRVGGTATITHDPVILERLAARGRGAIVCIHLNVEYAFFHCSKVCVF